mgnify:CR=1 FL=1
MSFPEGTIHYAGDHVILAGDMTPDQVAACVAAGRHAARGRAVSA